MANIIMSKPVKHEVISSLAFLSESGEPFEVWKRNAPYMRHRKDIAPPKLTPIPSTRFTKPLSLSTTTHPIPDHTPPCPPFLDGRTQSKHAFFSPGGELRHN